MYKIEFASSAAKQLEIICQKDTKLYQRIICAIEDLHKEPYLGKKLSGRFKGKYSYRVGTYRIVYEVFNRKLLIIIIDVGHRREVYRFLF